MTERVLSHQTRKDRWQAVAYGLPLAALILAAITCWFAVADRSIIFLYDHDMGPLVADTSAFSRVTASRYWMASLVACGGVMVLHAAINALRGIVRRGYHAPDWRQVWIGGAIPLLIGIPAITMTVNQPTLPLWNAVQVTFAALVGFAAALMPGDQAARNPLRVAGLAADGWGVSLVMFGLAALEHLGAGPSRWVVAGLLTLGAGIGWLMVMSVFRWWARRPHPTTVETMIGGATITYLLLPLIHHLSVGLGEGYFYISDGDNFFAQTMLFQIVVWLATVGLIVGMTWLRLKLGVRRPREKMR